MPLLNQANVGVAPPLVGKVVKLTIVPEHIFVVEAEMFTEGAILLFTVILMAFEFAVALVIHVALEVKTQVTTSALRRVEVLNVGEFVPTFIPLTFHW